VRLRTSTVCEGFYKKGIAVTVGLTALMILPGLIQVNAATPFPVVYGPIADLESWSL
jgi:hypothetical protein